jgi:hypothetical protein
MWAQKPHEPAAVPPFPRLRPAALLRRRDAFMNRITSSGRVKPQRTHGVWLVIRASCSEVAFPGVGPTLAGRHPSRLSRFLLGTVFSGRGRSAVLGQAGRSQLHAIGVIPGSGHGSSVFSDGRPPSLSLHKFGPAVGPL